MFLERMSVVIFCVIHLGCGALGGPSTVTPKGEVSGDIGGVSLGDTDIMLAELKDNRDRVGTLTIAIAATTGLCEQIKAFQSSKNTASIVLTLKNGKGDSLKTGSYPIFAGEFIAEGTGNYSTGLVSKTDATCAETLAATEGKLSSGTVTLTDYSEAGSVTGTFDVTAGSKQYTGSFAANSCTGVTQAMVDTSNSCI